MSASELKQQLVSRLAAERKLCLELFATFDHDGAGMIMKPEWYHALLSLGLDCSRASANELFSMLDENRSGRIQYNELSVPAVPTVKEEKVKKNNAAYLSDKARATAVAEVMDKKSSGAMLSADDLALLEASAARDVAEAMDKVARGGMLTGDDLALLEASAARQVSEVMDKVASGALLTADDFAVLKASAKPDGTYTDAAQVVARSMTRHRPAGKPKVALHERLLDLLPRLGPRLAETLQPYADSDGTVDEARFVRGALEACRAPIATGSGGAVEPRGAIAELGAAGRDTRQMSEALRILYAELLETSANGETANAVPVAALCARLRKLRAPPKPTVLLPVVVEKTPRLSKAIKSKRTKPSALPPLDSPREHESGSSSMVTAPTVAPSGHPFPTTAKASSSAPAPAKAKAKVSKRTRRVERSANLDAQLPALAFSVALEHSSHLKRLTESTSARLSRLDHETPDELHPLQLQAAAGSERLRTMMDQILEDPWNPSIVNEALSQFCNEASRAPRPPRAGVPSASPRTSRVKAKSKPRARPRAEPLGALDLVALDSDLDSGLVSAPPQVWHPITFGFTA